MTYKDKASYASSPPCIRHTHALQYTATHTAIHCNKRQQTIPKCTGTDTL